MAQIINYYIYNSMSHSNRHRSREAKSSSKGRHGQRRQVDSDSDSDDKYQRYNGRKRVKHNESYESEGQSSVESVSSDSGVIKFSVLSEKSFGEKEICPWLSKNTRSMTDSLLRLHNQIIQFYNYIRPSKKDHSARMRSFNFIKDKIIEMFPKAEVVPFGSFATQLYLPDGDIDVAVLTNGQYQPAEVYNRINKYLTSKQNATLFGSIQYIRKSKVPLIKFYYNNIHFDISVDKSDGINQVKYVQKINSLYPQFKYLTFALKCTLRIRGLGDTYTGGIGSFLLACLILAYLQHIHCEKKQYLNLGEHLIEFMKFYALRDDNFWERKIISIKTGRISDRHFDGSFFSCLSPQDQSHDIGKSAYKIRDVFKVLKNRCNYILDKNFESQQSILKVLINPSDQVFKYCKQSQK